MVTYRELMLAELCERIQEIDDSESYTLIYRWIDGEVRPVPRQWARPRWTPSSWRADSWVGVLGLEGVKAWGTLDGETLVGMIVYRPRLTPDTAQLAALFVNKSHRQRGIASRLTEALCRQARLDGHARLYVSANPSESAVNFYRSRGFVPTQDAHPELYALEPEDIHMVLVLS